MSLPVAAGFALDVAVESLGAYSLLGSRTAWLCVWALLPPAAFFALRPLYRHFDSAAEVRLALPSAAVLSALAVILLVTLVTALVSPPNNYDSLVYHSPRVMQWWSQGHLGFWPTSIPRQLLMPPLASYFRLALYGLAGSDLLFNVAQWLFFAFTIFGAWAAGESLSPGRNAGALASLLVATMPMAILQSTSAQNDLICGGYVVSAAYSLLRVLRGAGSNAVNLVLLGGAVGLACLTKGTAIAVALPLLAIGAVAALGRALCLPDAPRIAAGAGVAAGLLLAVSLNAPHALRILKTFASPQHEYPEVVRTATYVENGVRTGAGRAVSQLVRNGFLQLGQLRLLGVTSGTTFEAVVRFHALLGVDVNEPGISFPESRFEDALWQFPNHEDTASSTMHFLLAIASPGLLLVGTLFGPGLKRSLGAAFAAAWLLWALLCLVVAWMPWNQRLQLPAMVLLMVPAAAACAAVPLLRRMVAVALLASSVPYLLLNLSRPLVGLHAAPSGSRFRTFWTGGRPNEIRSILTTPRWDNYFRNSESFREEVESSLAVLRAECPKAAAVGLVVGSNFPEYLLWAGARHAGLPARFRHVPSVTESVAGCTVVGREPGGVEVLRGEWRTAPP